MNFILCKKSFKSLFLADYENWKPMKPKNETLMRQAHGLETPAAKKGIDNVVFDCETYF